MVPPLGDLPFTTITADDACLTCYVHSLCARCCRPIGHSTRFFFIDTMRGRVVHAECPGADSVVAVPVSPVTTTRPTGL
jgi:hypothetical protein